MSDIDEKLVEAVAQVNGNRNKRTSRKKSEDTNDLPEVSDAAKFKKFVSSAKCCINKNGKIYLLAEAWQYIMDLKNLRVNTVCTEERVPLTNGEYRLVVSCQATIYDENNKIVSTGIMQASSDEEFLSDKPAYAVYGLSQTRAISRAMRNRYGYLARACGFEAVPVEEINS